jgi:hypothetical protein
VLLFVLSTVRSFRIVQLKDIKVSNLVYTNNHDVPRLLSKVTEWAQDRNLINGSTPQVQYKKFLEESIELFATLNPELTPCQIVTELEQMIHDLYFDGRIKQAPKGKTVKDDVGDCIVVLDIIAEQEGLLIGDCLGHAYDDIKDRTGKMIDGVFVKEADYKAELT